MKMFMLNFYQIIMSLNAFLCAIPFKGPLSNQLNKYILDDT